MALRAAAALWLTSVAAAAAATSAAAPRAASIVRSEVVTIAGGLRLELALTRPVTPQKVREERGELAFELEDTRTGDRVVNRVFPGGALAELRFLAVGIPSRPRTRIVVLTRGEVESRVASSGSRLWIDLLPPAEPIPYEDDLGTSDLFPPEIAAEPAVTPELGAVPEPESEPEIAAAPAPRPVAVLPELGIEPLPAPLDPPSPRELPVAEAAAATLSIAVLPPAPEPAPEVEIEELDSPAASGEPAPAAAAPAGEEVLLPDELATPPAAPRSAPPPPPLAAAPTPAEPAREPGPASQVLGVELAAKGVVRIAADGTLDYLAFRLENPERFVLELEGVVNASPRASLAVDEPLLLAVRVSQYRSAPRPVTRIVFDLRAPSIPEIESTAGGLIVRFVRAAPKVAAADGTAAARDLVQGGQFR